MNRSSVQLLVERLPKGPAAAGRWSPSKMLAGFLCWLCLSHASALATDPTGVWRGEWRSGSTGHRGPMSVVIRPSGNGTYQGKFHGRFMGVIPFVYRADLHAYYDANGNTVLHASKPLGPLLGNYTMSTVVTGSELQGNFQAAGDRGTIRMRRVR
ncbi:MAG: hypothetical protein ACK5OB_07575 [Pirellula sp.]